MAKLPFIVEPRLKPRKEVLGTEASGKIEIERRGYLTAAERAFMQSQVSEDGSTQEIVRLCRKIGLKHKIDMQAAYELLSEVMAGTASSKAALKIADEYEAEISAIMTEMMDTEARKSLIAALCLLMYRIDSEIEADEVLNLHRDLLEALEQLYKDEESRSTKRLVQLIPEGENGDANSIDSLEKK